MSEVLDQIRTESEALAEDMERSGVLAEELHSLMASVNEQLEHVEQLATQLLSAAGLKLTDLAGELETKATQVHDRAEEVREEIQQVSTALHGVRGEVEQAGQAASQALETATTAMNGLTEGVGEASGALADDLNQLTQALDAAVTTLAEQIQAGQAALQEAKAETEHLQAEWDAFVGAVVQAVGEAAEQTAEAIKDQFVTTIEEAGATFSDALTTLMHDVLQAPIQALASEAETAIKDEMTDLADQAVAMLTEAIQQVMRDILESRERTDAEERLLRDVFNELRPLFDQAWSQFNVVDGIASAVGVRI